MELKNKVFVVTGGGNGIGRELVLQLLRKGARVAAVDINQAALEETTGLAGSLADKLSTHVANITNRAAVEALPESVIAAHGVVDGLINNAGIIQKFVKFQDLSYEDIDRVVDVNFYGTLYMTKTFLPYLTARPEAHLVNVSSMGGYLPVPGQTIYGAAKAAIKLFTEGLYSELSNTNVHVMNVFPGAIGTNIAANSGVRTPSVSSDSQPSMKTTPVEVAGSVIIDAIEKNKFSVYVGNDAKLMNFLYRLAPKWAGGFINKQMGSLLK